MDFDVKHLRLVEAIAEEGTQTRAARRLFLTQSALSHQLAELERRIGAPLFHRLGRRMAPTVAGRRVLETSRAILPQLNDLTIDLRAIARGAKGLLRLTTQCYTCYHWLPLVLPLFRERFPGIEVRIAPEFATCAIDALLDGSVDLALAYDFEPNALLATNDLWSDEVVGIVSPGHRLAGRSHLEAADFAEEHLLIHMDRLEQTYFYNSILEPAGVRPARVSPLRLTEGIVSMVAAGAGVAVVTRWTVAREIAAGLVRAVRVTEFGLRRDWQAVRLASTDEDVALEGFLQVLSGGPSLLFDGSDQEGMKAVAGIAWGQS